MEVKNSLLHRVIRPLAEDGAWREFFVSLLELSDFDVMCYLKSGVIPLQFELPISSKGFEFITGSYYKVKLNLPTARYSIRTEGWVFVLEDIESLDIDYNEGANLFVRFLTETPPSTLVKFEIHDFPTGFEFRVDDGLPFQFLPGSCFNLFYAAALCKSHLVFPYEPFQKEYKLRSLGTGAVTELDEYHVLVPNLEVPSVVGVIYDKFRIYQGDQYQDIPIKSIDGGLVTFSSENELFGESGLSYSLIRTYDSYLLGKKPHYIKVITNNLNSSVQSFVEDSIGAGDICDVELYDSYFLERES